MKIINQFCEVIFNNYIFEIFGFFFPKEMKPSQCPKMYESDKKFAYSFNVVYKPN